MAPYHTRYCDEVVAFMGRGYSLTAFAGEIGVCRETLDTWRRKRPAFDRAVKAGEAARTRALETALLDASSGAKVSANTFALKHASPEVWGDKSAVEVETPLKAELVVKFV